MAHHRHTNDPDHDPELQGHSQPETWGEMAWHLSAIGYWGTKARTLLTHAAGQCHDSYVSARAHPRVTREARWMLGVYGCAFVFSVFVSPVLLWVWVIPLILGFPVLRLYLLAEHGRCPQVANMFLNSRTTLTNRLVNAIAWNMPYHAEHHAFPNVPFHQLPMAHQIAKPHLGTLTPGYARFTKTYAQTLYGPAGGAP